MDLKNLIVENKTIKVNHPYLDGFIVELASVSRETLKKIMKKATTQSFDRKTHQPKEEIDDALFLELYVAEVVKGWSGLKYSHLVELMPINLEDIEDTEEELEYSKDNALTLMQNSSDFDTWVSTVIGDVKNFNKSN